MMSLLIIRLKSCLIAKFSDINTLHTVKFQGICYKLYRNLGLMLSYFKSRTNRVKKIFIFNYKIFFHSTWLGEREDKPWLSLGY
ncbi:hypothetical protein BXT84_14605 [Sulfobacillus thermotolerans]|uniref:Uncharacterized protein n=1 Tax=Sulfobacillus thermotolerans TaxID=338644 RepID=A0ABM6RV02_9FIRM|nr:hypothetical protein BXT84_14605 [Sulfobacillus thermotolerans]